MDDINFYCKVVKMTSLCTLEYSTSAVAPIPLSVYADLA